MSTRSPWLTDRAAAKLVLLVALSTAIGLWLHEGDGSDPLWLNLIASTILVFGAIGAYEVLAFFLGGLFGRTRLAADRRGTARRTGRAEDDEVRGFGAREAFAILGAYLVAQLVAGVVIMLIATGGSAEPLVGDRYIQVAVATAVAGLIFGGVAAWLVFLVYARSGGNPAELRARIGLRWPRSGQAIGAAVVGVGLGVGLMLFTAHFPLRDDVNVGVLARAAQMPGSPRLLWATAALLLAPPIEEFVFRGAVFGGLKERWGAVFSGVIATLLFVILHLPETWFHWPALVSVTIAGVALLAARVHTDSLMPPIVMHFFYNFAIVGYVFAIA